MDSGELGADLVDGALLRGTGRPILPFGRASTARGRFLIAADYRDGAVLANAVRRYCEDAPHCSREGVQAWRKD